MQVFHNCRILASVMFWVIPIAHAQDESGKPKQRVPIIAFIDIEKIMEDHVGLQRNLADLDKEQAAFEKEVATKRQAIKSLEEELLQYSPGSPDYSELEEHIVKVKAELEARIEVQEKRSARARAAAHGVVYKDIVQRVSKFAEGNSIGAVINYDSSSIPDSSDPDEVMKALKRRVVFQRNLDITKLITQGCNQAQSAKKENEVPLR